MKFIDKLDKYDKIFVLIIAAILIVQFFMFLQFKHIPGPIYGGDLYRERGFVQHIANGGSWFGDPYFKGESMFYPQLAYVLLGEFSKFTGISPETTLIWFPLLVTFGIALGLYQLGKTIFKSKAYALILAMLGFALRSFVVGGKPSYGLGVVFALFFLSYLVKLAEDNTLKTKILAGLFLGLTALSHYQPFLQVSAIAGFTVVFEFVRETINQKSLKTVPSFFKKYWLVVLIGFAISLIFFGPLIANYNMQISNDANKYGLFDITKFGFGWLLGSTVKLFFNFTNIFRLVLGITAAWGFVFCCFNFKRTEHRYALLWFVAIFLAAGHYLITAPLFNFWVIPPHLLDGMVYPLILLTAFGIKGVVTGFKKYAWASYIPFIFVLVLVVPAVAFSATSYNNDRWVQYGKEMDAGTKTMLDAGKWMLANTGEDDVFLGNDESMFAINALTGRKLVEVRRTHASPYVNVDKRYADAIVMLYGNNASVQKSLIAEYGVMWLYLDQFLMQYPMITSLKYQAYLTENGVNYTIENVRLDPSTTDAPSVESLVIPPQNLTVLDFAEEAHAFTTNGQNFAILYTFK